MLTLKDKIKLVDEMLEENPYANIRDYSNEVAAIESEILNIQSSTNDHQ